MPKRVNNIFYKNLKFKYMYEAYLRASKGKHYNKEVINYELDLGHNITQTLKNLHSNNYVIGKYHEFVVTKPKERTIKSLPFRDRVVQQWYVEQFIKPIFISKFIEDTYACLPNKGVHKAVYKLKKYLYNMNKKNPDAYILKCDISKFFYSIDKEILFKIMKRSVKDEKFLKLTHQFIFDFSGLKGIPIGNYTSQYFANIYLNELDHFIKEKSKVKYYVRYVDDFVLVLDSKEECKKVLNEINTFLADKLELKLNSKTNYSKIKFGVNFLGYKVYPGYVKLNCKNKKKTYKLIRQYNKLFSKNKLDIEKASRTLNSWIGHAQNANTYKLIKDVVYRCDWIYK